MKSMRRQLIAALLAGILLVLAVVGTGVFFYLRSALTRQFDLALEAKAQAAVACVHLSRDHFFITLSDETETEFSAGRQPAYFQIWNADGTVFARSPSLANSDLRSPVRRMSLKAPVFADFETRGEHTLRSVMFHFDPRPDDADDVPRTDAERAFAQGGLTIMAAQDRAVIDSTLESLIAALLVSAVVLAGCIVLVVAFTVRKSLRPLARVADEASLIDAHSLQHRFAIDGLPAELAPICQRFNDLLARLDAAFIRERRFTADVAHELRTPIAELRTLAEVAIRWPEDSTAAASGFRDALDISRHMERMVTTLLMLARCEAGRLNPNLRPIALADAVAGAWRPMQQEAAQRQLRGEFDIPQSATVNSDPDLLSAIVTNLLSNAVQYSSQGYAITCAVRTGPGSLTLSIANHTDSLSGDDLAHVFEPFWQKDPSRSRSEHRGLGLALVKAYADVLQAKIETTLSDAKVFCISIELPTAPATDPSAAADRTTSPLLDRPAPVS